MSIFYIKMSNTNKKTIPILNTNIPYYLICLRLFRLYKNMAKAISEIAKNIIVSCTNPLYISE